MEVYSKRWLAMPTSMPQLFQSSNGVKNAYLETGSTKTSKQASKQTNKMKGQEIEGKYQDFSYVSP